MLPVIFRNGRTILEQLKDHGHEAYFVGGAVRDFLLGKPIHDIDITTSATVEEMQNIFQQTIPVGIEHGTLIVREDSKSYEVTSYRSKEGASKSLTADLRHRDFTINAIAMDCHGKIMDYFHGKKDLENNVIRGIEDASARFIEDPLRMIRAARFASQLDFTIERNTLTAWKKTCHLLEHIAMERVMIEFTKLLQGKAMDKGMRYLMETNSIKYLPVLHESGHVLASLQATKLPFLNMSSFIAYIAYLDHNFSISRFAKTWKCSNQDKKTATQLKTALEDYAEHGLSDWLIYQIPTTLLQAFHQLIERIDDDKQVTYDVLLERRKQLPIQSVKDLDWTGKELLALFPDQKPGPWINHLLQAVERAVVMGTLNNNKKEIKEWIECHPPVIN